MTTKTKYNSKKVEVDNIIFDSKHESQYYLMLKQQKANGDIKDFTLQPKYELIPKFEKEDKKYRAMTYTPDFLVTYNDNSQAAIDVKGFSTQQGEIRKKLFNFLYRDVKLVWVSYVKKYGGFIEVDELKKIRKENKKKIDI